jgi:hypothetical protein
MISGNTTLVAVLEVIATNLVSGLSQFKTICLPHTSQKAVLDPILEPHWYVEKSILEQHWCDLEPPPLLFTWTISSMTRPLQQQSSKMVWVLSQL